MFVTHVFCTHVFPLSRIKKHLDWEVSVSLYVCVVTVCYVCECVLSQYVCVPCVCVLSQYECVGVQHAAFELSCKPDLVPKTIVVYHILHLQVIRFYQFYFQFILLK